MRCVLTWVSGLMSAELVVIGGLVSTVVILGGALVANAFQIVDVARFAEHPSLYARGHTITLIEVGLVCLAADYVLAFFMAWLIYRQQDVSSKPEATSWYDAFRDGRPAGDSVTLITVELRDSRRFAGQLLSFTTGPEDNRELALAADIYAQPSQGSKAQKLENARFVVFRESDIMAIYGGYKAGPSRVE